MKYIIFMMIPTIIITFLFNKGLLPKTIYYILLGIISAIGSIFIIYRLISIWNRDNMNYQEYLWSFNAKDAPSTINNSDSSNDPWVSKNSSTGTCIGDKCCADGMTFNTNTNQCVSSCSSATNSNNNNSTTNESFMNNIFTKKSSLYKKPDVILNSYVFPSNF